MKELEWLSGRKPSIGESFYLGGVKYRVKRIRGKKVVLG